MDPNETLTRILGLVRDYNQAVADYKDAQGEDGMSGLTRDYEDYEDAQLAVVQELVPLVESLHEWLFAGGFLPDGWVRVRHATTSDCT
jgi:hypothetical protein